MFLRVVPICGAFGEFIMLLKIELPRHCVPGNSEGLEWCAEGDYSFFAFWRRTAITEATTNAATMIAMPTQTFFIATMTAIASMQS